MVFMPSNWFVITGSPSSGKTTVIDSLAKLGYATVPEAARVLIDEGISRGLSIGELRKDEHEFQRKALELKVKIESEMAKEKTVFFDRAVPDSVAYYELYGYDVNEVLKFCKRDLYCKVFLLERLDFKKDYARTEDVEKLDRLQILLRKAYTDLGYEVVDVPAFPKERKEERIKFILSRINKQV